MSLRGRLRDVLLAAGAGILLAAHGGNCGDAPNGAPLTSNAGRPAGDASPASSDPSQVRHVIVAAGDIACRGCAHGETAALVTNMLRNGGLAAILPLGDVAYPRGSLSDFQAYYAPTWGIPELLAITHPVPGNHEYGQPAGGGYFDYFNGPQASGGIAGARDQGYYSYDIGSWHLVALNSNDACHDVSCAAGSAQQQWLAADLAAHPMGCALAYWHHPRFQSGTDHGETEAVGALWDTFHDGGGDVVLTAHEHNYQQLAPLDKAGGVDPIGGVRSFVVGTGGVGLYKTFGGPREAAIEARVADKHGVLELTLVENGYQWRFVTTEGEVPAGASGSASCR
jgi:acid phosphatase type 7